MTQKEYLLFDENGNYTLNLKANRSVKIQVSFIGYESRSIRIPMLKIGQIYILDIELTPQKNIINDVIVSDKKQKKALSKIKTQHVTLIPNSSGGIESVLKTLPGVSSANELSSQYSVRGGNFDENMVYVNGIEIYRPLLIHSGQQEGLSFVNSEMVESILFSKIGGFEAKYGDKMSSVLDIKYKKPKEFKSSIHMKLLGGSAHFEGITRNNRFSYLVGLRNKSNQYILNAMDTEAEYKPNFTDFQTYLNYQIKDYWTISFLGNISENTYQMIPQNRDTEFGTLNEGSKTKNLF